MTAKHRITRALEAIIVTAVLAVSLLPCLCMTNTQDVSAAATVKLTAKRISGGGDWTEQFSGGGYKGLCAKANDKAYASKKYTLYSTDRFCRNQSMKKLAYYYGYKKGWTSGANGCKLARAFNYVSTQSGNAARGKAVYWPKKTLKSMVKTAGAVKIPSGFECFFAVPTGNTGMQSAVIWKYTPPGKVTLTKTSAAAGYNASFAGCVYTIYKSDKKTACGSLECGAKGRTKAVSLPPGTYYVKETKANGNYQLSSTWYKCSIKSNKQTKLSVKDKAVTGSLVLRKTFTDDSDEGYTMEGFRFMLVNTANTKLKYSQETDAEGKIKIAGVIPGTYKITETVSAAQTEEGYRNADQQGRTIRVAPGETTETGWTNSYHRKRSLIITKVTDDGSNAAGFHFDIRCEMPGRELTEEKLLDLARIAAEQEKEGFTLGDFKADSEELSALNTAASEKRTGTFTVHVKTEAAGEDETETISIPVKVTLRSVKDRDDLTEPAGAVTEEPDGWKFTHRDFQWAGSADVFHKNDESTTTKSDGSVCIDHVPAGTYTVTEELTDEQQKHYKSHEPVTKTMDAGDSRADVLSFEFENKARWTDVSLKLTNEKKDEPAGGCEFTLTGTRDYDGAAVGPVSGTTDSEGRIEFGKLYAGNYVLEETNFDRGRWVFKKEYRLEGHDDPAKSFRVSSEEDHPVEIEFAHEMLRCMYLTKVDQGTGEFLTGGAFDLYENGSKELSFRIMRDTEGRAAADITWKGEDTEIFADLAEITEDIEEESPVIVSPDTDTADADVGEAEDNPQEESRDADGGETEELPAAEITDTVDTPGNEAYAVLKGVKKGAEYRITETGAPLGYSGGIDCTFTYTDSKPQVLLENTAPVLITRAWDKNTGTHISDAKAKTAEIVDTVSYENLQPGKEYRMLGRMYYRPGDREGAETGPEDMEAVKVNGQPVTEEIAFTAENAKGKVDVAFTVDARPLAGRDVVIFEELIDPEGPAGAQVIANHIDPGSDEQSIFFRKKAAKGDAAERVVKDLKTEKGEAVCDETGGDDPPEACGNHQTGQTASGLLLAVIAVAAAAAGLAVRRIRRS